LLHPASPFITAPGTAWTIATTAVEPPPNAALIYNLSSTREFYIAKTWNILYSSELSAIVYLFTIKLCLPTIVLLSSISTK